MSIIINHILNCFYIVASEGTFQNKTKTLLCLVREQIIFNLEFHGI